MKTLIRFPAVKIRFLFHPFTSHESLYVWHKHPYIEEYFLVCVLGAYLDINYFSANRFTLNVV